MIKIKLISISGVTILIISTICAITISIIYLNKDIGNNYYSLNDKPKNFISTKEGINDKYLIENYKKKLLIENKNPTNYSINLYTHQQSATMSLGFFL